MTGGSEDRLPVDLSDLINNLYHTQDYFVRLPSLPHSRFEEEYHETTVDPDGSVRHLLTDKEREHKLKNFQGEILSELMSHQKGKSILDIGCGPGWLLSALDDSWLKCGVEISKFASTYAAKYGTIYNGTLETYRTTQKFDVIVAHHVFEHLEDPVFAIKKIHQLLKHGGTCILGTPNFDSAAARRYNNKFRLLHDNTHISLFTSDSMHRFLRDHGFKIDKVEFPFFETDYFTESNLLKMMDEDTVSPPFYGSVMTFFATKI